MRSGERVVWADFLYFLLLFFYSRNNTITQTQRSSELGNESHIPISFGKGKSSPSNRCSQEKMRLWDDIKINKVEQNSGLKWLWEKDLYT